MCRRQITNISRVYLFVVSFIFDAQQFCALFTHGLFSFGLNQDLTTQNSTQHCIITLCIFVMHIISCIAAFFVVMDTVGRGRCREKRKKKTSSVSIATEESSLVLPKMVQAKKKKKNQRCEILYCWTAEPGRKHGIKINRKSRSSWCVGLFHHRRQHWQ